MAGQDFTAGNLKQRIRDGERVVGVMVPIAMARAELERVLNRRHFDFVWTDTQSSAFNEEQLVAFCEMAHGLGKRVQLRIKHTENTYMIDGYLQLGPSGVMIPQVSTEATVKEALRRFYYPPVGERSWGGAARVGASARIDRVDYARWWNRYGVLWLQLESVEAVTNARLLAKEGVDCVSFGKADLLFRLESHPEYPLRTVDDCVRNVVSQLKSSGVAVGFTSGSPAESDRYAAMGVTVFLEGPPE